MGRQLDATLAPEAVLPAVVQTLAHALKLPYVAVELGDGQDGHRGAAVAPAVLSDPVEDPLVLPLVYQQHPVGRLLLGSRAPGEAFTPAERRLLDDLARQVGVAAHAVRLTTDLQRSRQRLVTAREEERRRLRRDLHDGLRPVLAGVAMQLGAAQALVDRDLATVRKLLGTLQDQLRAAIVDIRRLVYGLRPPVGRAGPGRSAAGAGGPLHHPADRRGRRRHPAVRVEAPERLPGLPAAVEVAAYRIATEALTNVARHAHARTCTLRLACNGALELEVRDDGRGLPDQPRAGVGRRPRERAAELGGTCTVEAVAGAAPWSAPTCPCPRTEGCAVGPARTRRRRPPDRTGRVAAAAWPSTSRWSGEAASGTEALATAASLWTWWSWTCTCPSSTASRRPAGWSGANRAWPCWW